MNTRSKIVCTISFFMGVSAPMLAFGQSPNVASLLNKANQMNNQEQEEAKELRSKAGDNQALVTMADTLTQDHKANQAALEALAQGSATGGPCPSGLKTPGYPSDHGRSTRFVRRSRDVGVGQARSGAVQRRSMPM